MTYTSLDLQSEGNWPRMSQKCKYRKSRSSVGMGDNLISPASEDDTEYHTNRYPMHCTVAHCV